MNTKHIHEHCPEVDKLMGGRMPFVTRWGITFVILVFLAIGIILLQLKVVPQQLIKEMVNHTIEQIIDKYN